MGLSDTLIETKKISTNIDSWIWW